MNTNTICAKILLIFECLDIVPMIIFRNVRLFYDLGILSIIFYMLNPVGRVLCVDGGQGIRWKYRFV
jgi:hypothetical protein